MERRKTMYSIVLFSLARLVLVFGGDFKSVPTTVKTHENDTVLLPCYLDGTGTDETGGEPISIRWYKYQDLIASTEDVNTVIDPERTRIWANGSLEVFPIKYSDTGEYMCEVVRKPPWGSITQLHAIEVLQSPSVDMIPPDGFLQVKLGDNVEIECNGSGVPAPLITWRSKGKEIELLSNRKKLKFEATDKFLSGEYECVASNGVGTPAVAKIELNIIYPPDIIQDRPWIHTSPGLRANLDCVVNADPVANVTWYKSNIRVTLDNRVLALVDANKHSLIIRNVRISDFGIYVCKAENVLGSAQVEVQLSGVANPGLFKFVEQKENEKSRSTYTLVWEVDSYSPIIEYNLWFRPYKPYNIISKTDWIKLTIPADHSTGPMHSKAYTITGLKERTVYEAMLFSRNRYGWSKPSKIMKFATTGTEIEEENITQIQIQENIVPISSEDYVFDLLTGNGPVFRFNYLVLLLSFMFVYFCKILLNK